MLGSLMATGAQALDVSEKNCILSAAQHLPKIPGLAIRASRAKALSAEDRAKWRLRRDRFHNQITTGYQVKVSKAEIGVVLVEIDITVAGQDSTLGYVCVYAPDVSLNNVHPIGMQR